MDTGLEQVQEELSDDNVRQMLILAERLRESHGGSLDDSAIAAVSEATGAPQDYVRLAVRMLPEKKKHGAFARFREIFLALEPDVRRNVISGLMATNCALFRVLAVKTGDQYNLFGTLLIVTLALGLWNMSVSKDSRVAMAAGAIFGLTFFVAQSLFSFALRTDASIMSVLLIPTIVGGAITGMVLQKIVEKYRPQLGIKDPAQERQQLLRQLVDLQDKLRSGEQSMTFLAFDVVGSTKMKQLADPLSVEFTFNEYHQFVEMIVKRYTGRIHSTAGDGITCAFEHPQQAYAAARNVQAGIVELNTFRNKLGVPLVLRAGIHTGAVMAPEPGDITSLNFAHVLDVASHLQRCAPPGGIAVSIDAAKYLPGGSAGVGTERVESQGVPAVVWAPRPGPTQLPAVPQTP